MLELREVAQSIQAQSPVNIVYNGQVKPREEHQEREDRNEGEVRDTEASEDLEDLEVYREALNKYSGLQYQKRESIHQR